MGDVDWLASAIILVVGFFSGVLASLVGVGGAVITTPLIRFMGATPIAAVGSTVPAILPGAISGSLRYRREGYIQWRPALLCAGGGLFAAIGGAWVADVVDARALMILTAVLVLWSGGMLLRGQASAKTNRDPGSSAGVGTYGSVNSAAPGPDSAGTGSAGSHIEGSIHPSSVAPAVFLVLGVFSGFLAGLLGIGGGVVLTPGLTILGKMPVKNAVATSLTSVAVMSVSALTTHIALGHVDWRFALPLAIGIVPGVRAGAAITVGSSEQRMRTITGSLLVVIALFYLGRELAAF